MDQELIDAFQKQKTKRAKTVVEETFGGVMISTVKCSHCPYSSENTEPFLSRYYSFIGYITSFY